MTLMGEKMKAALDKRHEDRLAKGMSEALDPAGIHFNVGLEDNPRLKVFNPRCCRSGRRRR